MKSKDILELLEADAFQEEKNVVLSTRKINIGRTSGMIAIDPTFKKPILKPIDIIKIK